MEKKKKEQLYKGSLYHCLDTKNTFFAISGGQLDRYSSAVGWQSASRGEVFNDYENNEAEGSFTHAEGSHTHAVTAGSHAEGYKTIAGGKTTFDDEGNIIGDIEKNSDNSFAHSEGLRTIAYGRGSHAEGGRTQALDTYTHAEGQYSQAVTAGSHAEGYMTVAGGKAIFNDDLEVESIEIKKNSSGSPISTHTHAEGNRTSAAGLCAHAEGYKSVAEGNYSHAEGHITSAFGDSSHAEGSENFAVGKYSHAEGCKTIASGKMDNETQKVAETSDSSCTHAEGYCTSAYGYCAHSEGLGTLAQGDYSHAENYWAQAIGESSHAEGCRSGEIPTVASGKGSHAEGWGTLATGEGSHTEGISTIAHGRGTHTEGYESMAGAKKILNADKITFTISYSSDPDGAHAEGKSTTAFGSGSHAEGMSTLADGLYSHAEGNSTRAQGQNSHAEGFNTVAQGNGSHAEGNSTYANGYGSHAEGGNNSANHRYSHAEGYSTLTGCDYQHVQGKFNISENISEYAHIVGNGTSEEQRSNAHTLDWQGNAWFAGEVRVGGTGYEDAVKLRDPDWSHLKWYVLGDSLTVPGGVERYAHTNKFYYEYIQEKTHIELIGIDGAGGTGYYAGKTNDQNFYFRISQNMETVQTADIITILGSVNDIRYSSQAEYQPLVENTLATLTSNCPGVPVIVIPPPLCDDFEKTSDAWKNYCNTLEEAAFKNHCRYVGDMFKCPPFDPKIATHMEKFFNNNDGTHPNEVGHKAIASYIYNAMRTSLALE